MPSVTQTASNLSYSNALIGIIEVVNDTSNPYRQYRVRYHGTIWYATSDELGSFAVGDTVDIKSYATATVLLIGHRQVV